MVKGSINTSGFYLGNGVINPSDLNTEEQQLLNAIKGCLKDDVDLNLLVVQQLTSKYLTLVYETWYNDFIRFKYSDGEYLFLLNMYPDMRKAYKDDELFAIQEPKNRVFWQAKICKPEDVLQLKDAIIESCLSFEKFNPEYYED